MAKPPAIIVIGTSEGGVEALRFMAAALPADLAAALFVVLHIGARKSELARLLNHNTRIPAIHPRDGDLIQAGHIYVGVPDHHLVIDPGRIRLTKGPSENWTRPAIDPLFRSAANAYGADVIGVVLTGGLNDGTAGLYEIKRRGGVTVVQDPADAISPSMPRSALAHVEVDYCLPLAEIPALLVELVAKRDAHVPLDRTHPTLASGRGLDMTAEYKQDRPVAVTCPDCGGALRRLELGTLTQFACHIGHIYTAEVMVAAQFAALDISLAAALRSLSERAEICRQMADKVRTAGNPPAGTQWDAAMRETMERAAVLRGLIEEKWTHPGDLEHPLPAGP